MLADSETARDSWTRSEVLALCKILHMDTLVEYMGNQDGADKPPPQYERKVWEPLETKHEGHMMQRWMDELTLAQFKMEEMRAVQFVQFDLDDSVGFYLDWQAVGTEADNVTRRSHNVRRPNPPSPPAPPTPMAGAETDQAIIKEYEDKQEKYREQFAQYQKDQEQHEADLKLFEQADSEHAALKENTEYAYDSFKSHATAVDKRITDLRMDKQIREEFDKTKRQANLAFAAIRCSCEDLAQAIIQIFYTVTFKYNKMVVASIFVSFGMSFLNVILAWFESEYAPNCSWLSEYVPSCPCSHSEQAEEEETLGGDLRLETFVPARAGNVAALKSLNAQVLAADSAALLSPSPYMYRKIKRKT